MSKALTDHKITQPDTVTQVASTLFGNRVAGDFVNKILTQRQRIEKNQANLARAPDDPAAHIMAGDPIAAWNGVGNAFDNLAAAIPASGGKVTGALNEVSATINDWAARLQGVKTDHARIAENHRDFGIDAPADLSKLEPAELSKVKAAGLADLKQKLLTERLEMKGLLGELARRNGERSKGGFWERLGFGGPDTGRLIGRIQETRGAVKDTEAAMDRLSHLGAPAVAKPAAADPEHERIVRAATGGATLGGQKDVGAGGSHIDVGGTLTGEIQGRLEADIRITPSSELVNAMATIKQVSAKVNALAKIGGGKGGPDTGRSMSEAQPNGGNGGGWQ